MLPGGRRGRGRAVLAAPRRVARDAAGRAGAQGRRPVGRAHRGAPRAAGGRVRARVREPRAARSARRSTTRTARSTATRSCRRHRRARPTRTRAHGCAVCAEVRARARGRRAHRLRARRLDRVRAVRLGVPVRHALRAARARRRRCPRSTTTSRDALAALLHDVLGRYDRLWPAPHPGYLFPYLLWFHQAPASGGDEWHVHGAHRAAAAIAPACSATSRPASSGSGTLANPGRSREPPRASCAMPERRFRAPARVNLIGGQVDYHEGIVVSMAIDRDVVVAIEPRADGRIARPVGRPRRHRRHRGRRLRRSRARSSPRGVARSRASRARSPTRGHRRARRRSRRVVRRPDRRRPLVERGVRGRGRARARATSGIALPIREVALVAQEAEHVALGVPCGIQDQLTSLTGARGCAVRIDCRTLDVEPIPIPAVARRRRRPLGRRAHARRQPVAAAPGRQLRGRGRARPPGAARRRVRIRSPTRRAAATSSARSRASSSSRTRCARATSTRSGR